MFRKSKIRAEELLAKENFSEELLSKYASDENIDENEIQIAKEIYTFLHSSGKSMTITEKEQTKNHIRSSIRRLSLKRQLVGYSVAASILLAAIITSVNYFRINATTDIVSFAQTLKNVKAESKTCIILQNGDEVQIDNAQSQIKYDAKGENIIINSEQKVAQKMNNSKAVFNTLIVPFGKRTQITLSEGTKVWLNSGSKMVYPVVFAENKREVYIDGEAVFEVVHMNDKPFVVSTKDFDVKVLGTVFNVSVYSDDKYSSTVLEKGKIELNYKGVFGLSNEKMDVTPGFMAVFDRDQNTFVQQKVDPQKYLSWREGYLTVKNEKLENILKKLSRYYNIEMVITDNELKNETFSGYLDLKNSPQEVLSVINETTSLTYE